MQLFVFFLVSGVALANAGIFHPLISKLVTGELYAKRSAEESESCNILRCVSEQGRTMIHPSQPDFFQALTTADGVNALCTELLTTADCVRAEALPCPTELDAYLSLANNLDEIRGYVCSEEGRDLAVSQAACWRDKQVENTMEDCYWSTPMGKQSSAICSFYDRVRECAKKIVQRECNSQAARFVDNIMYHNMRSSFEAQYACQMTAPA